MIHFSKLSKTFTIMAKYSNPCLVIFSKKKKTTIEYNTKKLFIGKTVLPALVGRKEVTAGQGKDLTK